MSKAKTATFEVEFFSGKKEIRENLLQIDEGQLEFWTYLHETFSGIDKEELKSVTLISIE